MRRNVYIGLQRYAVYFKKASSGIKTLIFETLPSLFKSSKIQILENCTVYGNSKQEEFSRNLLNPNGEQRVGYIASNVGSKVAWATSTVSMTFTNVLYVNPNETYTFSFKNSKINGNISMTLVDDDDTVVEKEVYNIYIGDNQHTVTFQNSGWLYIQAISATDERQLERGSEATPYVPYGAILPTPTDPVEVISVGDKSINIFNFNECLDDGYGWYGYNNYRALSGYRGSPVIQVKGGRTYTLNISGTGQRGSANYFLLNDGSTIQVQSSTSTITVPENAVSWVFNIRSTVDINSIMIVEGEELPTEYKEYWNGYRIPIITGNTTTNIYLDQPLRKVGEYSDIMSIDGNQVTVTRNIGYADFANLTFQSYEAGYQRYRVGNITNHIAVTIRRGDGLCTAFSVWNTGGTSADVPLNYLYWGEASQFYIVTNLTTDKDEMKNILSGQLIYYPLLRPATETYIIDNPMQIQSGTLIIDTNTVTKPSKIEITGEIDNV